MKTKNTDLPRDWKLQFEHGMLVIEPPIEVKALVNKLREKYDPESQKISEAHISLTQPFLAEPDALAWEVIKEILDEFNPFEITFGPIDAFEGTTVVKFQIHPRRTILSLREKLHKTGLFNLTLPFTEGFIPHMTISEFAISDKDEAKQLAKELNGKFQPGKFMCDKIEYVRPNKDFYFEAVKFLSL